MMNPFKKISVYSLAIALFVVGQVAFAHTRLQIPQIDEDTRVYNNEVIGHGCKVPETGANTIDTLGTVLVFPDGVDSSITVDGEAFTGPLTDFVQNWGSPVSKIQNKNVFAFEAEIADPLGNVFGYWAGGAPALKGGLTGLIPFRTSSVIIEPTSCAKSIKFVVAIADICEITDISGFNDATVMLWTPAVGSNFDGGKDLNGYNSPASLTVNRTASELPASCGDGVEVMVTPSAAQLNRDMSISVDGNQIWPKP